jgi:tripartite ATP-independent transporter DctM subunit
VADGRDGSQYRLKRKDLRRKSAPVTALVFLGILLIADVPIAFALIMASILLLAAQGNSMISATQRLVAGVDSFPLLAIPFFILAGGLMNAAGVTDRIFGFARSLVGHITGGVGHVNVLANLIFSGMTGSALAEAGGLGLLEIKAMRDEGWDDRFSGSLVAAACIVGPIVPPSIPLVLFGVMFNTSIGALFLAGIVPGLLVAFVLMAYVYAVAKRRGYKPQPRATLCEIVDATRRAFWALLTPVIILGGIFGGIFTPTEAAAVAAVYSLVLGFLYRTLSWRRLGRVLVESANTTAVVGLIIAGASLFNWVLARDQIPQRVAEAFLGATDSAALMLFLVNVLLLILGAMIESIAVLILLVPFLQPLAGSYGIDPVHFGIIIIFNLMIGLMTPPFGMALFVVAKVGNIPYGVLARGILPFLIPLILVLFLVTYVPAASLFIPHLFGY